MTKNKALVQQVNGPVAVQLPVFSMPARRRTRLNGSCAVAALLTLPAAMSVGIMLARPAQAATTINTDKNATAILGNYNTGNPFTITSGTTITAPTGDGVYGNAGTNWTLTNYGVVVGGTANGVGFSSGGTLSNADNPSASTIGTISGASDGVYVTGTAGVVSNIGLIEGSSNSGIELRTGGYINNQNQTVYVYPDFKTEIGTIVGGIDGVQITGTSASIANGGTIIGISGNGVENLAGGSISNYSTSSFIHGQNDGIHIANAYGSASNFGTVSGGADGIAFDAGGTVANSGQILGGTIGVALGGGVSTLTNTAYSFFIPRGYISGSVDGVLATSTNAVVKTGGGITGGTGVYLKAGGYLLNSYPGQIAGTLGNGVQAGYLGNTAANTGTLKNVGFISGSNDGVLFDAGGTIANLENITGGVYGISITNGAGTVINSAATDGSGPGYISGGVAGVVISSDDALVVNAQPALSFYPPGTITGSSFGVHLTGAGGSVVNYGLISAIGQGGVAVSAVDGSVLNAGYITGNGAGIEMTGGGDVLNFDTITGAVGVGIDGGGSVASTVVNYGFITGTGYGVSLADGPAGPFLGGSGTINALINFGNIAQTATSVNPTAGVVLAGSDAVYNGVSQTGFGGLGSDDTLAVIMGTAYGVLSNAGTVVVFNIGTITGTSGSGIRLNGTDEVENAGTVLGGQTGINESGTVGFVFNADDTNGMYGPAFVSGSSDGVLISSKTATMVNFGTVVGYDNNGGLPTGTGVSLGVGGLVLNSTEGSFGIAIISGAAYGVDLTTGEGQVGNSGYIVATNAGGTGVALGGGGFLSNSSIGTIQGGSIGVAVGLTGGLYAVDYGSVVNYGLITGAGFGISMAGYGAVDNQSTGYIRGGEVGVYIAGAGATLANSGTITTAVFSTPLVVPLLTPFGMKQSTGVSFANGGNVTNYSGGYIYGGQIGVSITGGVQNTVINQADATIVGAGNVGVDLNGGNDTLANAGSIFGYKYGAVLANGGTVYNSGSIIADNSGEFTTGISLTEGGSVTNTSAGVIYGYVGGIVASGPVTIANAGTILAPGKYYVGAAEYQGIGVYARAGGTLTNSAGGLIQGLANGVYAEGTMGVVNSGSIVATGDYGIGVALLNGSVTNYGVIYGAHNGVYVGEGSVTNAASGYISGYVDGVHMDGSGADMVANAGTINGFGSYGTGVFLQAGGTVTNTGLIEGGYYGVYTRNSLATVINSGTIVEFNNAQSTYAAVYLYAGGSVVNMAGGTLQGASSGVIVNNGFGTIINAGVIDGIGYDGVSLNHGGSVVNSSGATIIGGHIGVYTGYAGASVNNYGFISGADGDGVSLYQGGNLTNNASAAVFGSYNGVYIYGPASSVLNAGFISGGVNGVLANGGSVVNVGSGAIIGVASGVSGVSNPVYVTNTGVIIGGTIAGVSLAAGGTVTNGDYIGGGGSGVIIGGVPGTVINYGGIIGRGSYGVQLTAGGYVNNHDYIAGELTGVQISNGLGTVINSGEITSHQSGNDSIVGVALLGGGYVLNTSSGTINGYGSGVDLQGAAASLVNAGSINGYHDGVFGNATTIGIVNMGTITGKDFGAYLAGAARIINTASALIGGGDGIFSNAAVYVGNAGAIFGTSSSGLALFAGGTVNNMGAIGGIQYGVDIQGGAGTVINSGAIAQVGGSGGATSGIYFTEGGSINNSGLIGAYNNGILVKGTANIVNSGTISGSLQGGVVLYGGSLLNTSTGTITGIGNTAVLLEGSASLDNSGLISNTVNLRDGVASGQGVIINREGGTISGLYGVSANGGAVLNAGLINATGGGVSTDGTVVANYATGRIIGDVYGVYVYGHNGTLSNAGTISGGSEFGVTLKNNGTVTNDAGGVISGGSFGIGGKTMVVTNGGLITGAVYDGIDIGYGTVVNTAGGTITGGEYGVSSYRAGVTNAGSIGGGAHGVDAYIINVNNLAGGAITGDSNGVAMYGDGGSVMNAGLIVGTGDNGIIFHNVGAVTNLAGGAISGYDAGVIAYAAASVMNAGTIMSERNAVRLIAGGYVGNTSTGTLTALQDAVRVEGAAGTVINDGQISSTGPGSNYAGINFYQGGEVENAGLISGGGYGIILNGFGGTVVNMAAGKISSGYDGISADGGTIVNAGSITGANEGVYLDGGTLMNMAGGVIKGGEVGLYASYGAVVTNAGLIADNTNAGAVLGNDVTLTNLQGGTISGVRGAEFTGTNATLFNAGTIASTQTGGDAVYFGTSGTNFLTLSTGSKLIGNVNGGGSDSQIDLIGTGTIGNTIDNFGTGSALNVASGANWTAIGNWTIATVTNNGTFQAGQLYKPLSLTGNFIQASLATLRVVVTPTLSSQFLITGTAQLAGALTYVFAPGYYAPHTYDFLTATDGVTGNFDTVNYTGQVPPTLTHTTNSTPPSANLVLSGNGIVTPEGDSLFNEQSQAIANSAQEANTSLLGKASQGAGAGSSAAAACAAEQGAAQNTAAGNTNTASRMASAVASAFCGAGGWIEATGTEMNADANGGAADYHADSGGFLAGIDKLVNNVGTRIGLAVGYDETWLHDGASGKGSINTARVGLYASQPLGRFTLAADFMYGHGDNTTNRATGVGQARATYGTDIISGGIQGSTEMTLGPIDLVPALGLRIAHLNGGGFAETGGGFVPAFAVTGKTGGYTSIQPFVNVGISHNFLTATGLSITPSLGVGYTYEAGDRGKSLDVAANGFTFTAPHNTLDASTAVLSAGIAAGRNNWSLYAHYTAYVSGNWTSQTAEAGLQVRF